MKIRNGFVSNSSSSSFVLALGKIEDEEKFNKIFNEFNDNGYEYCTNIIDYNTDFKPFFGSEVFFEPNVYYFKPGDKIFTIEYYGDEGDDHFYCEETDELDYEFEFDDLDIRIHDFIENVKPCLSNFQINVGAERIG